MCLLAAPCAELEDEDALRMENSVATRALLICVRASQREIARTPLQIAKCSMKRLVGRSNPGCMGQAMLR